MNERDLFYALRTGSGPLAERRRQEEEEALNAAKVAEMEKYGFDGTEDAFDAMPPSEKFRLGLREGFNRAMNDEFLGNAGYLLPKQYRTPNGIIDGIEDATQEYLASANNPQWLAEAMMNMIYNALPTVPALYESFLRMQAGNDAERIRQRYGIDSPQWRGLEQTADDYATIEENGKKRNLKLNPIRPDEV